MASAQPDPGFWEDRKVTVTGGAGFLGKAVVRQLEELGALVRVIRSSEHDLRDAEQTRDAVDGAQVVLHLAARVGGIGFNRRNPAPLAYDNLMMGTNVFEQSRLAGVRKLVAACCALKLSIVRRSPSSSGISASKPSSALARETSR